MFVSSFQVIKADVSVFRIGLYDVISWNDLYEPLELIHQEVRYVIGLENSADLGSY